MLTVTLAGCAHSYPLVFQPGGLQACGQLFTAHLAQQPNRLLLVSDEQVWPLYGPAVQASLEVAGFNVSVLCLPCGETQKTLESAQVVWNAAFAAQLTRRDAMVALGGGVVGDLVGFCAATYYRGTGFVQLPTTLLAQVDSSVGGKVAVNSPQVKNSIGCFYQPQLVILDPTVLSTLPSREHVAGMAEVAKYALIEHSCTPTGEKSLQFAQRLLENPAVDSALLHTCCQLKAWVVQADEHETTGHRALLNLGHTLAHALEELTHYQHFKHGEAVAWGLYFVYQLAEALGTITPETHAQAKAILHMCQLLPEQGQLPAIPPICSPDELLAAMRHDKKAMSAASETLTFVLPVGSLGHAQLCHTVDAATVLACLKQL